MAKIEIKAVLLEDSGIKSFTKGNDTINFRTILARYDGKVLKFPIDIDGVVKPGSLDKEVTLVCELVKGQNQNAKLKVVEIK